MQQLIPRIAYKIITYVYVYIYCVAKKQVRQVCKQLWSIILFDY